MMPTWHILWPALTEIDQKKWLHTNVFYASWQELKVNTYNHLMYKFTNEWLNMFIASSSDVN